MRIRRRSPPILTNEIETYIDAQRDEPFFSTTLRPIPITRLMLRNGSRANHWGGDYGDCVEELDWSVGQSYRKLMQKGMADHTLFLFTSDNGPWYEGNPGLHRGRKGLSLDGGQVVPCIAVYPEHKQKELKRPPGLERFINPDLFG